MTAARSPLPPLHKSVTVPWPSERAFRRFTYELGTWWLLGSHSVAPGR